MHLAETESLLTAGLAPRCSTAQRAGALRLIRENDRIPAELALTIYRNNLSGALIKALTAAFPACRRILGDTCFNSIAHRFIEHSPSEQADLNHYGASFSDFVDNWTATQAPFSDYRYLGDLARLEWHCHTAYYATDDPQFDFKALAEASRDAEETLRFQLAHSLSLLQSDYPLMEIRETNLYQDDAAQVRADELPEYLVVSRPALQARVERVDAVTFQILSACQTGRTLADIANSGRRLNNTLLDALTELIQRRWITGFTLDGISTTREPVHA